MEKKSQRDKNRKGNGDEAGRRGRRAGSIENASFVSPRPHSRLGLPAAHIYPSSHPFVVVALLRTGAAFPCGTFFDIVYVLTLMHTGRRHSLWWLTDW